MTDVPQIIVLSGGVSEEREVSLQSGQNAASTLKKHFSVELIEINQAALPQSISARQQVVFPALHGTFGEDGSIQDLMDTANIHYAGSDAQASRLCFNKEETKERLKGQGVRVPPGIRFSATQPPERKKVVHALGEQLIMKPVCQGSSVGLHRINDRHDLENTLSRINSGEWLIETYLKGREISVGVLKGKGLGLVEIVPEGGIYDYYHKYTAETTQYHFPAKVSAAVEHRARSLAEQAFAICGCRDFARIDFILTPDETLFMLEINTLPGLTPMSLLPKSAACMGYDFEALLFELVQPAINRFQARLS